MVKIVYSGFRFRETRGGTPDRAIALSMRGEGGVRLEIGGGKTAMMAEADRALSVEERAHLVGMRRSTEIVEVSGATTSQTPGILVPETIDVPGTEYNVARGEITVAEFRQFVENSGYVIEGNNADKLKQSLADRTRDNMPLKGVNEKDCLKYTEWLAEKTGRAFFVPNEKDWYKVTGIVRERLSGTNYEWTRTQCFEGTLLCTFSGAKGYCLESNPKGRGDNYSLRLFEHKKA